VRGKGAMRIEARRRHLGRGLARNVKSLYHMTGLAGITAGAGCGDSPTASSPRPSRHDISGAGQSDTIGTLLAEKLIVEFRDDANQPIGGARIVFHSQGCTYLAVSCMTQVARPDGTNLTAVSPAGRRYWSSGLAWSPDGEWILAKNVDTGFLELIRLRDQLVLNLGWAGAMDAPAWMR